MPRVRINLSIEQADLDVINRAAEAADKDRSSYMVDASLYFAGEPTEADRIHDLESKVRRLEAVLRERGVEV